ncbi:hypothetical protein WJX72_001888 [[Myrmecia] bisecta]|uniref:Uncharacterized protein n=1 Tax=[Myrmecia] bisecta TaxID=41462 RepID=A0AAW1PNE0_9CHLO
MRSRQQPGQGAVSPGVQKSAQITSAKFGDQAHGWGAVRPLSPCAELPGHLAALYTNLFQVPPRVASPAVRSTSRAASPMPCQVASRRSASRAGPPNLPSWAPSQENQAPNDDEHMMDAYIAEFKRRKSMPAAATVIAASWRAYRPRQLYLRFKAMRARNAAATIAPYFAAWARQRLVSRHPRLAAQARIFRHWLEITRLTKELYLRVTKGLQAAFAKTNMGALMLWRLCKAASEAGGAPASMRLSSALIIVMQRRYPLRIMQTAFEHWRAKRAFLARRRLHAISHLTHALGCWPITTLRPAFRFWYQYTMILKAGRAGQPLPLFPAQESADWESWRWAHEHRLKRKQHVIALHQVTRLQRCFLALRARAVLGKAMRQAWARATRHHVDLLKRLALRALQQNRKRRAVLRRVKGAIFQAWQQVTARHLQLRGIIIKLQAVSARSARRDAFTRWAARRLRFRNLISLHLSMPNLYLMKATFVGWRLVAATPHARKALVSLHVTELPVWPPPYLGSTRSSRRQSATGVLQNNEHLMAAKIQKMMMVDITSDKGPLLALPPAPLVVESDTDWLKTSQHVMSLTWRSAPCDIPLWQMATASLRKHHRTGRAAWQHQPKAGIAVDEQIAGFHEALCRAEGLLEQVALQAAQLTPGSSDAEAFWNALWRAGLSTSKFVGDLLVVLLHRTVLHDMACARARLRFRLERDKWLQDRQQYLAITQAMARNPSLLGNLEKTMCGPETHQVISQQLSILFTPEADDIDLIDTFASGHLADYAQLSPGAEVSTELGRRRKQRPPRSAVFKRLYEVPEEGQAKRQARLAREKELREALQYTADQQQRMAQEAERIRLKAHSAYRSVAPHTTGGGPSQPAMLPRARASHLHLSMEQIRCSTSVHNRRVQVTGGQ